MFLNTGKNKNTFLDKKIHYIGLFMYSLFFKVTIFETKNKET